MAVGDRQKLITEVVSTVLGEIGEHNKKFEWFINKHTKEDFGSSFSSIDRVFQSLNGDANANQTKRTTGLECDAYFGGEFNFIFEFDEFQHFSSARLRTFDSYPNELRLNFDKEEWKRACTIHKNRADKYRRSKTTTDFNFDGGRTAQRAYLDCFRDLLPEIHGLKPTLRINEFEVAEITRNDNYACRIVEQILTSKLSK
ncbi:MAG: hypothetical protein KBF73_00005 [Flavobacteriales bacterium]|nr:hypothetical protein [Flavobacteriales bacterium]